ncbi:MAG: GTP pyrophosphokinase [Coriobacteriales bacterium]|nr:GTP pyrophosphokinase [Coriobacteriales bacterium]
MGGEQTMLYTTKTKAAMRLAYQAHAGQTDRAGLPYIFHPYHLAEQMHTEDEVCVALLHDVLEDTDKSEADLRAAGMSEEVLAALRLLTHDPSVPYRDYVARLADNPLAHVVKIADLRHNSDLSRLDKVSDKDRARVRKYAQALAFLGTQAQTGSR